MEPSLIADIARDDAECASIVEIQVYQCLATAMGIWGVVNMLSDCSGSTGA